MGLKICIISFMSVFLFSIDQQFCKTLTGYCNDSSLDQIVVN